MLVGVLDFEGAGVLTGVLVGVLFDSEELGAAAGAVESPLLEDSFPPEIVAVDVELGDDFERLSVL
ncbi:MAG: hypothetical protein ABI570_08005 [Ilumatobacteraceae bacterium]